MYNDGGYSLQVMSVLIEYEKALRTGASDLAKGIYEANPDLHRNFDRIQKKVG